ncbi:hypothetical protein JH26_09610 [Microvirga sp. BSC39]|nr:hypothetical protein JH26_09610 [Microvirga sp. BSC39]
MDILLRFLTRTMIANQKERQLSEARRNQADIMQFDNWQTMRWDHKLAGREASRLDPYRYCPSKKG